MSESQHAEELVLKGALLLRASGISEMRPTRDIDVLRYGDHTISKGEQVIADCCEVEVKEDGLRFDPQSVNGQEIREQEAYEGIRIKVEGYLGNARIHLQVPSPGDVLPSCQDAFSFHWLHEVIRGRCSSYIYFCYIELYEF